MEKPADLVQGTLDFLILKAVELEPRHGWDIATRVQQISGDLLKVDGSESHEPSRQVAK